MGDGPYRRVLLKVSGEALMGDLAFGIDPDTVNRIALQIKNTQRPRHPDRRRRRRRKLLARRRGQQVRHGPRDRRLRRHAGDGHQRPRSAGRDRERRRRRPHPDRHPHPGRRRAVHPPPRDAPPREGPRRHLRRRHRQPLLHHRHRRRPARHRDGGRRRAHRQEQGRRRVRRRPSQGAGRPQVLALVLHGRTQPPPRGDGQHRAHAVHGEQAAHPRVRCRLSPTASSTRRAARTSAPSSPRRSRCSTRCAHSARNRAGPAASGLVYHRPVGGDRFDDR